MAQASPIQMYKSPILRKSFSTSDLSKRPPKPIHHKQTPFYNQSLEFYKNPTLHPHTEIARQHGHLGCLNPTSEDFLRGISQMEIPQPSDIDISQYVRLNGLNGLANCIMMLAQECNGRGKRLVITVSGLMGSGKTSLNKLIEIINSKTHLSTATLVSMDTFLHTRNIRYGIPPEGRKGFERHLPCLRSDVFAWESFLRTIQTAPQHQLSVDVRNYDESTGTIKGTKSVPLSPIMLIEGCLTSDANIYIPRDQRVSIYVDVEQGLRLDRLTYRVTELQKRLITVMKKTGDLARLGITDKQKETEFQNEFAAHYKRLVAIEEASAASIDYKQVLIRSIAEMNLSGVNPEAVADNIVKSIRTFDDHRLLTDYHMSQKSIIPFADFIVKNNGRGIESAECYGKNPIKKVRAKL